MSDPADFDLKDFTPYMLAMAAETSSAGFQQYYRSRYNMLRTEWRVLFHLGRYGKMTAKDICAHARIHKTKVSRAVAALEAKRYLSRQRKDADRRHEDLLLTKSGRQVFNELYEEARRFDARLMSEFSPEERRVLRQCLSRIAQF